MPHNVHNIHINGNCQDFILTSLNFNEENTKLTFSFVSKKETSKVICPYCGKSHCMINDIHTSEIKDIPYIPRQQQSYMITYHRYRCLSCNRHFTEDIPLKVPNARITIRAAIWVKCLLAEGLSINSVSSITNIHWDTIKNIHQGVMDELLKKREKYLKDNNYKPKFLAVDEFAIHKGHKYATCVMDLETGEILWVGKGRATEDFRHFFIEYGISNLTDVKAFAMDMNASFNKLVEEYLPHVEIVYDRYHMQAQFGRDVLGAVRLEEAREHQKIAQDLKNSLSSDKNITPEEKKSIKASIKEEKRTYSRIKKSRWAVLSNHKNLSNEENDFLQDILNRHSKLSQCYAMKEEMSALFELKDIDIATEKWTKWFEAAKSSQIPQLVKFAELKQKRLKGLIAHSKYPISTGKLEGMNNKIKVAKRIAYGYRDEDYFFTLIRYKSTIGLPTIP